MAEAKKRCVIHSQAREMVYNVYKYFLRKMEEAGSKLNSVAECCRETAEACQVGIRTVERIASEAKVCVQTGESVTFSSPGKVHKRNKPVTDLDDFDKNLLRRKIFAMYENGKFPTAQKLVTEMKEDTGFEGSESSMLRILKKMGFRYRKCHDGRKIIMERSDIIAARAVFLRTMHSIRSQGDSKIYYLDETWVNQNHTRSVCWQMSDGSGGLKVPIGKGGRLILCHAGSADTGFIPESKLIFRSKSKTSSDYHTEMNACVVRNWFLNQFLPFLAPKSVIVMDNASIHSVLKEKIPCSNTRKADIMAWLSTRKIPFTSAQTREELLQIVKLNKPQKCFELDTTAAELGHRVVRLPPYHCQYNPIELVWAQVKAYVAEKNNTFRISDVERLTHEAVDGISITKWHDCVQHAEKLQEDDFHKELSRDAVMEPIIVNLRDSDSEGESSDEE